jgi:hypothetical protein
MVKRVRVELNPAFRLASLARQLKTVRIPLCVIAVENIIIYATLCVILSVRRKTQFLIHESYRYSHVCTYLIDYQSTS